MLEEVKAAVNFIGKLMYSTGRVTKDSVDQFKNSLENRLHNYYDGHWFPGSPNKGSGYRCIRVNHIIDPILDLAARDSGISNLLTYFPNEFTMWVDPFDVSYRIGENGSIGQVYGADDSTTPTPSTPPKSDLRIPHSYSESNRSSFLMSCKDQLRELASSKHGNFSPFALAGFVSS